MLPVESKLYCISETYIRIQDLYLGFSSSLHFVEIKSKMVNCNFRYPTTDTQLLKKLWILQVPYLLGLNTDLGTKSPSLLAY